MRDLWMLSHPGGSGFGLPVRQQVDDLMRVQVHNDCAEGSAASKGKIVEAKTLDVIYRRGGQSHHPTDNGHPGRGDAQMRGQSRTEPATGCQADGLQRLVQAGGHLCPRRDELGEPFRENLTHTLDGVTKELTDMQNQLHLLSSTGEVFHQSAIAAMQAGSWLVTQWTPSAA